MLPRFGIIARALRRRIVRLSARIFFISIRFVGLEDAHRFSQEIVGEQFSMAGTQPRFRVFP
jgi:hypothetical protein